MPPGGPGANSSSQLEQTISDFLRQAASPAVWEQGQKPFLLWPDNHHLEIRGGFLTLQVWDAERSLSHRITRVLRASPGKIELETLKLAGRRGRVLLYDQEQPKHAAIFRRAVRGVLQQRLYERLCRQFPGWRVEEISSQLDLEHTLSAAYPRAFLRRGSRGLAAVAAPASRGADHTQTLTHGLLWFDYLHRREPGPAPGGLALFLPAEHARKALLLAGHLHRDRVQCLIFACHDSGETLLEGADAGNFAAQLQPWKDAGRQRLDPETTRCLESLAALPDVDLVACPNGEKSLQVRGLEFARLRHGRLCFVLDRVERLSPRTLQQAEKETLKLAALRCVPPPKPDHPWFRRQPEGWLASVIRRDVRALDATLQPEPVYSEIFAAAAADRRRPDLLAVDYNGRLTVIEVKAAEDFNLPMQALDYWVRAKQLNSEGAFQRLGYYRNHALTAAPPRVFLVAPALAFHSTTETLLRYYHPTIEVTRIGVAPEWHNQIRVLFRLEGSRPAGWRPAAG